VKSSVLHLAGTEGNKFQTRTLGTEVQAAVRAELEMMLAAPIFAQSNRCKSFLNYVVEQTLSGHAHELKERTVGIKVFERANDYDTGDDSIVRVTANDVRKRISQFYRESSAAHSIQIELPRGAYVPEFRIRPVPQSSEIEDIPTPDPLDIEEYSAESLVVMEGPTVASVLPEVETPGESPIERTKASARSGHRKLLAFLMLSILLLAGALTLAIWKGRAQKNVPQVWDAFLNVKTPILLCLGAHDLHLPKVESSPDTDKFANEVLHKQIISMDDAAVVSSMASLLGKKGIPFRVVGAERTSLSDFRLQPVILIGAVGNKWTLRLTQGLRYRIEITHPYGMDKDPVASIVDANQPTASPWKIDFSVPISAWKSDYAIVAKMDDVTTGVPVLIEAGLGNDGSLAASELLTGGSLQAKLTDDSSCKGKSNFEAVVGTEIIDTKSGPPHIIRLNCW